MIFIPYPSSPSSSTELLNPVSPKIKKKYIYEV